MASDGPSKPLVPPPPTIGGASGSTPRTGDATSTPVGGGASEADDAWLALIEDEAKPAQSVESDDSEELQTIAVVAQTPGDEPEADAHDPAAPATEDEADEPPSAPQPRRGVLPPPRSDGKRVQPLAAKSSRSRGPTRPSATGLPSGMRPPGAPEEREHENTDVLIASAVAALTHEGEATSEGPAAAASRSSVAAPVVPAPSAAAETDDERRKKGLWLGVAALAAAVLLLALFATGDDEAQTHDPATSSAAAVVSQPNESDAQAVPEPAALEPVEPVETVEPVALADALDVGDALDLDDALDVGGDMDLTQAMDIGSVAVDEGETEAAEQDTGDADAGRAPKRRKSSRSPKRRDEPKPSSKATAKREDEPDAAELLAAAQKALRSGQSRKAYSLASKSRRAKKSSDALVVMARAACRFGSESQAKSAFDKLTIGDRRGIRAECRDHGVRLGL